MSALVTNNASATLAAGISSSAVSISVTGGQGAKFPNPAAGQWFYATLVDASNNLEIVKCTARAVDVLTVVRGQEGTTARAYLAADRIELRPTAALLNEKVSNDGAALTSGRVPYANSVGSLVDSANLVFDGTTLTPNTLNVTDKATSRANLGTLSDPGGNGLLSRTSANTTTARSLTQPAAGITVTNGDGVAGNPTLALANDLSALEALGSTGIAVRTGADAWAQRTLTAGSAKLTVSQGDGVAGNPTVDLGANAATAVIGFVFDGGGAVLTTGVKGDLLIPFACTIQSVTLQADQSGSIVIDIWKKTYTLDSPPTVANTITAAALPTLASHQSSQDATLTGWTTAIAANDMLRFNINSITTCTRVTLTLKVTRL